MSNSISDQLADLSDEDQEQFHAEAQRSLRRHWAKAKNKQEKEIDEINKKRSNY